MTGNPPTIKGWRLVRRSEPLDAVTSDEDRPSDMRRPWLDGIKDRGVLDHESLFR